MRTLPSFFLTPSALSDFSLLIFIGATLGYLIFLLARAWRRGERPVDMALLAGAFTGVAVFIALTFLERRRPACPAPPGCRPDRGAGLLAPIRLSFPPLSLQGKT
jgi:hypothetical protein